MTFSLVSLLVLSQATPEPTVTLADLQKACAKGDQLSCVDYAFNLESADPAKAVTVYRAACAKNAFAACSNLALMLRDARGAPKNYDEAAKVAKKACDGGNLPGCLHFALVKDAANDLPGATAAYEVACAKKVYPACTNLAINLLRGAGTKKNEKRALEVLESACQDSLKKGIEFASLRACFVLGQLYEGGGGVTPNKEAAKKLYSAACFSGLDEACEQLGGGHQGDGHGH